MSSDLKCSWHYYPKEVNECQGEVDEYYGTDGGLAPLCEVHLHKARHVVWDDTDEDHPVPMSKKHYDEVYSPRLEAEREAWLKKRAKADPIE